MSSETIYNWQVLPPSHQSISTPLYPIAKILHQLAIDILIHQLYVRKSLTCLFNQPSSNDLLCLFHQETTPNLKRKTIKKLPSVYILKICQAFSNVCFYLNDPRFIEETPVIWRVCDLQDDMGLELCWWWGLTWDSGANWWNWTKRLPSSEASGEKITRGEQWPWACELPFQCWVPFCARLSGILV